MNIRFDLLSLCILCSFILIGIPLQTVAQTATPAVEPQAPMGAVFSLRPINGADLESLQIELEAGQSGEITVVLGNQDEESLTLRSYVADAISNPNGGFGLLDESASATAPTTWIEYTPETYDLAPSEEIIRTFAVTVPEGTPAGQYVSGIALQTAEPIEVPGTDFFNQIIRKIVPVFITVPGPIEASAELGNPYFETEASSRLVIPIENTGNVLLQPTGPLSLSDTSGEEILTAPITMSQVYSGHQTIIVVSVPPQVSPGDYILNLELGDSDTGWSALMSDVPVTLSEPPAPEATPEPVPVEITNATVTPTPDAASGAPPQYADVAVEITNRASPVSSSRLTMVVERDGEVVEELVLSESLALLEQTTTVERPYIPEDGWQPGTYTFSLLLESVDPNSGVEAVLATIDVPDEIVVPE